MRRLIVVEYLSLDGVMQAPGHAAEDRDNGFTHGGWSSLFREDHRRYMTEAFKMCGAVLLGRVTYDIFASYWPTVTDEADAIARTLNSVPKFVASTTMSDGAWRETKVIRTDVPRAVAELKQQDGKDIFVIGSSCLAQTLIESNLIDEYQLLLHPLILGSGKRLFKTGGPSAELELVSSNTSQAGLVTAAYRPAGPS